MRRKIHKINLTCISVQKKKKKKKEKERKKKEYDKFGFQTFVYKYPTSNRLWVMLSENDVCWFVWVLWHINL